MTTLAAVRPIETSPVRDPDHVQARNDVLLRYMPLVRYVARRVAASYGLPHGVEVADLVSYGLLGLAESYERYDPSRGAKFETFAIPRIRGAIVDELRHHDWVPRNVRTRARQLGDISARLTSELGRAPTREEIADTLGLADLDGFEKRGTACSLLALDDIVAQDMSGSETSICDQLVDFGAEQPGSALEDAELKDQLLAALGDLDERERLIVTLYYFEGVPLGMVARLLGVTESRVSQLHTRALSALRGRLRESA